MSTLESILIALAGIWAGTINTIVGSGTLVTFPVLVALGIAPVTATISNAMGLIAGNAAGALGYRKELKGLGKLVIRLLPASLLGGIVGAYLLLHLPESVFEIAAPFLIVIALSFVILQPKLQAWVRQRAAARVGPDDESDPENDAVRRQPPILYLLVFGAGVYGGYFVAAQGILLVGILGVFMVGSLQSANAMKNVLVLGVNVIAAISYMLFAFDRINWWVVLLIAIGSTIGGIIGARIGRRLSPVVLRGVIVVLGIVALWAMIARLLE